MNKSIFKTYLKIDKISILWTLCFIVFIPLKKFLIPNVIMFLFTFRVLDKFGSKDFKMFISLGCTRKKYYINKIKSSLITSVLLSTVCTVCKLYETEFNSKYIYTLFLFYFIFFILFSSIEIFIEVLSISQYAVVEFGVLFFYFPLYIVYILFGPIFLGDTEWILNKFIPYFWGGLASICFNMFMTTVALKTTEI